MQACPLVIVAGPTASGKTAAGIELAVNINAEIISVDSVQVYKGLDIGSAKPTTEEQARIRHHLLDVCQPGQSMDAGKYLVLAQECIREINGRGKNVVLVGGTGLYLKALLYGLAEIPPIEPGLRLQLQEQLARDGLEKLRIQLEALDPDSARRIKPADRQRTLRALEVVMQTGRGLGSFQAEQNGRARYPHLLWGMDMPREQLRARIAERAEQMWRQGLLDEVQGLLSAGLRADAPALASLGYRQAVAVLQGRMAPQEGLQDMIKRTQAYAKRQQTWFKAMPGIRWVNACDWQKMLEPSKEFLKQNNGYL